MFKWTWFKLNSSRDGGYYTDGVPLLYHGILTLQILNIIFTNKYPDKPAQFLILIKQMFVEVRKLKSKIPDGFQYSATLNSDRCLIGGKFS